MMEITPEERAALAAHGFDPENYGDDEVSELVRLVRDEMGINVYLALKEYPQRFPKFFAWAGVYQRVEAKGDRILETLAMCCARALVKLERERRKK